MNQEPFGLTKGDIAQWICDTADASGYEGKQWGIMANSLRLYLDLAHGIIKELGTLGYPGCRTAELQADHELCRIEGDEVIVSVQMARENNSLCYDTVVYCAQPARQPVIAKAINHLVQKYGRKHCDLIRALVAKENNEGQ